MAVRIFKVYLDKTEEVVKNNPYKLVEDVDGIGFLTADKIAQKVGIPKNSDFRFRAGIMHILKEISEKSGNTYILKRDRQKRRPLTRTTVFLIVLHLDGGD